MKVFNEWFHPFNRQVSPTRWLLEDRNIQATTQVLETKRFISPCFRLKSCGCLHPPDRKQEKLHTGIDLFFGSFGSTVLKKTDQEIGFLAIPFQTDRFSFCASKFEDAIC